MNPNVSVIIPAYNRFSSLVHVVDSVLAQTVPVSEVIIIDDGSTDETPESTPRYIAEKPAWRERVRYFRQENQGLSAALNAGIAKARSEWLGFVAHDDLWLPWKLEWQFRALEKYKDECGLCFTDAWFMNNPHMKVTVSQFAGKPLDGPMGIVRDPVRLVVGRHPVWTQTVIARADLVHRAGNYDAYLRYSEDHDFLFRMGLLTKFCYVSMPMVLIDRSPADIRHVGEGQNWHKVEYRLRMDQYRFEKQWKLSEGLPPDVCKSIRSNLRGIHSHWATCHLAHGDYEKARKAVSTAAGYDLTPGIALKWMLINLSPALAQRIIVARDQRGAPRHDRTSWRTAAGQGSE
jgi:glycosyltransferase involved in cell wall biosynthesis